MIKTLRTLAAVALSFVALHSAALNSAALQAQSTGLQHLAFVGLRSILQRGQINAVATDKVGNLYLLLDQRDGIRLLKTDPSATTILAQALVGAPDDVGLAMALDPSGNIYITGTSTSGSLTGTTGAAFASPIDTSVNSFVARFDAGLNLTFLTFCGSSRTAAAAIAATSDAVFVTGLIYSATLPVTPSGIIQAPAFNSFQNGFVEKFSTTGSTLLYATYLSGATGDTTPMAIVADPADNAYIAGFTTASGFPTIAALVPRTPAPTSGFLTKLTPAGDGIIFSTFIPGDGITSLAIDTTANNLLLSGNIALGQFPITNASTPLVALPYQVLVRMPLDGSAVLSSTIIAPGTQSVLATAGGAVWVDGPLTVPLLPLTPLSDIGTGFAVRVSPTGPQGDPVIDQATRLGGVTSTNPGYASLPINLTSLAVDNTGSAIFAGGIAPTASTALLPTQTYDLPLSLPTVALPSIIHDAVLTPGTCNGSLCAGSAAYLARITPTAATSLIFSTDASPLIILRNLGSTPATGLQVTATGFTLTTTCGITLAAGDECTTLLTGTGPGSITARAVDATTQNATIQTAALAAVPTPATPGTIVFSPKELDFGIQTSSSQPLTRTITITNLGPTTQAFRSALSGLSGVTPYTFAESASDCPLGNTALSKQLAAGASCHVTLSFTASTDPKKAGPALAHWSLDKGAATLTGYAQAGSLNLSSGIIDFGVQFNGGLTSARSLYLSNNSDAAIAHTVVTLPSTSPFHLADRCPAQLEPHTVCQLQIGYTSLASTSTDSITLTLDQNLSVLITGETIPQPGTSGSTTNPSLTVSPTLISFPNAVAVTSTSSTTQTVTIQNTGTSSFALGVSLTGDFTHQTNCAATLAAGASCSVILTFAPAQPGTRDGFLSVTAGSGTTPIYVTLTGTGTPILPANNGTLAFGDIPIGQPTVQWYKVSQPFTTLTAATLSSVFRTILVEDIGYGHGQLSPSRFLAATTGACLNCWLGIQFTPTLAGPQTASLTLASSLSGNPSILDLTGSGVSSSGVILTPTVQNFGTIPINSSSAPVLFTLTNATAGSVPITVNAPTITGDFSLSTAPTGGTICGGQLAIHASCFVQILFAPTITGQRTGAMTLITSDGTATTALSGFGSPDPGITFNPAALIFNNIPGITATQQTITVSNPGTAALQVGTPSNLNPAFTSASTCGTLAPAASCTLTVTYTPASATTTDILQLPVTSNAAQTTYPLAVSATYTSQGSGLQILPNTAIYGPSAVNLPGDTRQFTLNNLTAKSLTLALTVPREFVLISPPCITLTPRASCEFSVSFVPLTNGPITGTLSAQGTPSDGSASVNGLATLQGHGLGTNALTVTGNLLPGRLLSFGQVPSGQSARKVLTLTNTSTATISIRRVSTQWPFLSTTTCATTLAASQSCTITISYTPLNQVATGTTSPALTTDAGTLTIESDAISAPDLISLAGTATATSVAAPSNTAPLVSFTASQSSLNFDITPIGFTSVPQSVTLTNTGSTVIHIASLATGSDFTATGSCAALIPGASCVLTIAFAPQVSTQPAGIRIGAVEIVSDSSASLEFLSLMGTASPSTLLFQPGALNFGAQLVGTTTTLSILITNAGTAPAIFNGITTTGDYAATSTCPAPGGSLAPNATCTIAISFTPTARGVRPGTISLASSVSTSPLVALLTGTGVQSHLQIGPGSLNFASAPVGKTASLSLTLANTGTAPITALKFAIAGDYALTTPCAFAILATGASCSVTIAFTPTAAGTRTGKLTITSSDPTSPDTVALTGSGTAVVLPSNASFSLTVNGSSSATQSVPSAHPATYALAVTPLNGYAGTVVLACSAITAAPGAACSLLPATISLSGTGQSASVTINTVTSSERRTPILRSLPRTATLCILIPSALFFWGFRKRLRLANRPASLFLALIYSTMLLLAAGCGSGRGINLNVSPSGSYQYMVTASSTTGTPLTQSVTLNLTIP